MLAGMCGERISPGVCDKVSKRKDIQQVRQQQEEGEEIQKRTKNVLFTFTFFSIFQKETSSEHILHSKISKKSEC